MGTYFLRNSRYLIFMAISLFRIWKCQRSPSIFSSLTRIFHNLLSKDKGRNYQAFWSWITLFRILYLQCWKLSICKQVHHSCWKLNEFPVLEWLMRCSLALLSFCSSQSEYAYSQHTFRAIPLGQVTAKLSLIMVLMHFRYILWGFCSLLHF